MISVLKAAGATVANSALQLVYQNRQGFLTDVYAAGYRILNSGLTQVFPGSGTQALAVTSTDRVGVGRYNATWDSSAATVGNYVVRWFLTPNNGDPQITFDQDFELVTNVYKGPHYTFVQSLKDEGLPSSVSDTQAQILIVRASRYVEFFTGRVFVPQYVTLELDGNSSRAMVLNDPIVALESAVITFDSVFNSTSQVSDPASLKVYNRHLTQGLVRPDDRDSPKVEFVHGDDAWGRVNGGSLFQDRVLWPKGVRNVQFTGIFGYTEADGSYVGHTPDLVQEATKMIVFDNLNKLSAGNRINGPLTKERTRDQEVDYLPLRPTTMTGNRQVDILLAGFKRAPSIASV